MKKNRALAVLLSSMMAMPFITNVMVFADTKRDDGLHIARFDDYQGYEAMLSKKTLTTPNPDNGVPKSAETANLPASFDLRDTGVVTSVKDQNPYGTCWTFAAMGSLESQMVDENPDVDLSEWHLAHYTYSEKFGYPYTVDYDGYVYDAFDSGGNYYMLASMLTGWIGPVDEAVFPYDNWDILEQEKSMDELREEAQYHVSEAALFPYWYYDMDEAGSQVAAIKQAIYEGHVMSVSYFDADDCRNPENYAYYCDDPEAYYGGYHAVNIVGWDDNYSASNFNVDPGMDGAWLIKNSWGEYWGDGGYFWMSYADTTLDEFFYLEDEDVNAHDDIYLHDDYGYWSSLSISDYGDTSAYMANIFTAEEDTTVTSAMFCTAQADEQYKIVIYTGLTDDNDPTSGTASGASTGMVETMGYHTVDLDAPVPVKAGEKFSVVVQLSGESGYHITCESATLMELCYSDDTVEVMESILTGDMLDGQMAAGESFYSEDGKAWTDMADEAVVTDAYTFTEDDYDGAFPDEVYISSYSMETVTGNVCVRALTKTSSTVEFSPAATQLSIGDEITLSSPDGSDIYYSFDGENYELYTAPIVFDGDMTVYAYTSTDATVVSRTFEQKYASIGTLTLTQQDEFESKDIFFQQEEDGTFYGSFEAWSDACDFMLADVNSDAVVSYQGEVLESGVTYELPLEWIAEGEEQYATFVFEVTEEGAKDATYIVTIEYLNLDTVTTLEVYCEQQDGYEAGYVDFYEYSENSYYGYFEAWEDACDYMYMTFYCDYAVFCDGEELTVEQVYEMPLIWEEDVATYVFEVTLADGTVETYEMYIFLNVETASNLGLTCEQQDGYDSAEIVFTQAEDGVYYGYYEAWSDACDYMSMTFDAVGEVTYNGEVLENGTTYELALEFVDGYAAFEFELALSDGTTETYVLMVEYLSVSGEGNLVIYCEQQDGFGWSYINFTKDETDGIYYGGYEAWSDACDFMYMTFDCDGEVYCDGILYENGVAYEMPLEWVDDVATYTFELHLEDGTVETYVVSFDYLSLITYGDVNYDGDVNANDAADLLVYAAQAGTGNAPEVTEDWLTRADFNMDGVVDANDASEILLYSAMMGV